MVEIKSEGKIISLKDGVAFLDGLETAMYGEVLKFENGLVGLAMHLEESRVGAVILGDWATLNVGDKVTTTGKLYAVPSGKDFLGRVVDALGNPLDGKADIKPEKYMAVERVAAGIVDRSKVSTPLQTGIKAVDAMIPIGRGQRELIIGDRGVGKTAIAIDTIINQKATGVICLYVAIGQKRSKVASVIEKLDEFGVLKNTIVVLASASDPASLRYLAPYVGTAMGEFFMEKGNDVLVVYDDLTKHAWAYRELSLLLRRPTGREAYPGDVFYLHSRLLERSCKLSKALGGGSLTALPIIETQSGDVSAFIPTNVISITDGQIYLENDLFFAGVRPALNVGLSVSRVGGAAQRSAMKKVAGKLRLDLSQYYELATFAQFSSDLDPSTREKIERGKRIIEILKQPQYAPIPVEHQVVILYTVTSGSLDDIAIDKIIVFQESFMQFITDRKSKIVRDIADSGEFSDGTKKDLDEAIAEFKEKIWKTQG
ncbi:F0F1 ATP synthase subunit alpha [Candidatus Woesebacteria bacterium RIFCSPHIGHO2_02_FULL_42_20]|uniref:ATP synthase subunit alpha n=1 Tax=Candidatus Woesebacteria bacterium RIFCSPHIGHO2_12_FULL_41_24 TaxID=1802510 RepID=A0A1F8AV19_9BACT|nr:MAG: F0F1 ATP synthase subunit alpha [Candidatus Woesebacteria bacterium RBG_16_41_13]OGM30772.1 MAG: F0F1 ATP synthase subunit alpha [Candidatus Woesebacteria bacterium RIFCSPHIGHO2_01_FULL_42_80]OGM34194.1 MAG: F0F1 ATP synthase subunit alpha [Candidatus Woesebacteria bacterium RIFCSPHIGHO2_02_FULL_42_20]OGM55349.1 MAG: F0F1 ATP synthase subunit alpha [Candidatus Woesebacteria bacterium RIFCSPHIGHO2_12_FULL_41_24]OGM68289.1 MAG: F0F1 ATP synthase subunit alpha [Candidatus Woesebacteria bac